LEGDLVGTVGDLDGDLEGDLDGDLEGDLDGERLGDLEGECVANDSWTWTEIETITKRRILNEYIFSVWFFNRLCSNTHLESSKSTISSSTQERSRFFLFLLQFYSNFDAKLVALELSCAALAAAATPVAAGAVFPLRITPVATSETMMIAVSTTMTATVIPAMAPELNTVDVVVGVNVVGIDVGCEVGRRVGDFDVGPVGE